MVFEPFPLRYKPYCHANNQNQVRYWLRIQRHNYNSLYALPASYFLGLNQRLNLKIDVLVQHLQHHDELNNHLP